MTDLAKIRTLAQQIIDETNVTEPPPPKPERIAHGTGRLKEATTTFGPTLPPIPKGWRSANLDRMRASAAGTMAATIVKTSRDDGYENLILTVPLAWGAGYKREPNYNGLLDVIDGDYDDYYRGIAEALMTEDADGNPAFPKAVLRLGHEHNMAWTPWYSGDGRAKNYAEAFRHVHDIIRPICPDVAFDWNLGAAGADYDDTGDDGSFDPESWPGDDYVDVVGRDYYCRGAGRDVSKIDGELSEHFDWATAHGKPMSFPEVGVTLNLPGKTSNHAATDSQAAQFLERMFIWADSSDLAYLTYWNSTKTSQGYRYRVTPEDTETMAVINRWYGGE